MEALSVQVDDLSKLLEEKNQENKGLIEEKASVSQLQDQHSIELAKHKTKLDDACKHYQNTLKEEQSKLQLVTVNFEHFRGEYQNLKAERDKLLQDIEKMSQSEATLQKEFKVQSEEIQTRQVKCGCT